MNTSQSTAPLSNGKEAMAQSLRHLVDEAEHFLTSSIATGDEAFETVRDQLAKQVRQMREQLDELEEGALQRARRAARAADRAVHDRPYSAMGIAAALGLLVGFLATRR